MRVCTYCGAAATDRDHVIPVSFTHGHRTFFGCELTPACSECNNTLGSLMLTTIPDRAAYLETTLRKRHGRTLRLPEWTEDELAELKPSLRRGVVARIEQKRLIGARLENLKLAALGDQP